VSGQALNLGVQDAFNLGWKLAAQVRGRAAPELLDSYHDERHPVGERVLRVVAAQTELLLGDGDLSAVREVLADLLRTDEARRYLAETLSGVAVRYDLGAGEHPCLGVRLPHAELLTRAGRTTTTELLRRGRGLLLDLAADAEGHDRMRLCAGPWQRGVDVVVATAVGCDAVAGLSGVLVRPDGHVAWVGGGPEGLEPALLRWFGAPQGRAERPAAHHPPSAANDGREERDEARMPL